MSKRKTKQGKKGLIVGLVVVAVLGAVAGVAAVLTKGFQTWGPVEKYVKGGTTVLKLDAVDFNESTKVITFKDAAEEYRITAAVDLGSQSEDETKFYLGDAEVECNFTEDEFTAAFNGEGVGLTKAVVSDMVKYGVALDAAKVSVMTIDLNVDYAESKPTGYKAIGYFDAIRINYHVENSKGTFIVTDNSNEDDNKANYAERSGGIISNFYENINLFKTDEDNTLSENRISFYAISPQADLDNRIQIKSIEFIKVATGHANEECYFAQL